MEIKLENQYKPIDVESKFDSKKFSRAYQQVGGLEQTLNSLKKDSNDLTAIQNAGIITYQNPNFYTSMDNPGLIARHAAEKAHTSGDKNLLDYTVKNSNDIYGLLGSKEKTNLLMSSYIATIDNAEEKDSEGNVDEKKTSHNKEYNEFAELSNLSKDLGEIAEKDDAESRQYKVGFIAKQSQYSPEWAQEMNQTFLGNEKYLNAIFQEYMGQISKQYTEIILDKEGKPNESKLEKFSDINFELQNKAKEKDEKFFRTLKDMGYASIMNAETEKAKEAKNKQKSA